MSNVVFLESEYFHSDFYRWKPLFILWMQKVNEQIVENNTELDDSEAAKYEFIHESFTSLRLFQPNEKQRA